jgi:hypothetical protein
MDSSDLPVFVAYSLCPPHLRRIIEDAVEAFDGKWLLAPVHGELFATANECLARLQGYTLSRGFAVVTITSKKGRAQFAYVHHSKDLKNWRKLEHHVEKDFISKEVVSKRRRQSHEIKAKGCTWEIYWLERSIDKRGNNIIAG